MTNDFISFILFFIFLRKSFADVVYWNSCEIYTVIVFVKYHIFSFLSLPRCFLSLHCREFPLERRRELLLLLLLLLLWSWLYFTHVVMT